MKEYRGMVFSFSNEKLKHSHIESVVDAKFSSEERYKSSTKSSSIKFASRNIQSAKPGANLKNKSFDKEYSIKKFEHLKDGINTVSSFLLLV